MTTDLESLTPRQREILVYIVGYTAEHAMPPTMREIGNRFAIRSPNGVVGHLQSLARKGAITLADKTHRGIGVPSIAQATKDAANKLLASLKAA